MHIILFAKYRNAVPKYRYQMTRFRKVPKYRNRMTRFQVPNTDTAGTKKVPIPSSDHLSSDTTEA